MNNYVRYFRRTFCVIYKPLLNHFFSQILHTTDTAYCSEYDTYISWQNSTRNTDQVCFENNSTCPTHFVFKVSDVSIKGRSHKHPEVGNLKCCDLSFIKEYPLRLPPPPPPLINLNCKSW